MINSWSLLYDELYGDDEMTEDNTITPQESDEYDPKPQSDSDDGDWNDPIITVGSGSTASVDDTLNINIDSHWDSISIDTSQLYGDEPLTFSTLSDNDDSIAHHITAPTPGIEDNTIRKYKEDEAIKALQDYISTTYGGHYTSKENNVQTLDLIESVGDAESFCRSNAIKYLSRYDKKGQAKRDILKALHYTLLLYHFSGQLNETPTRGYETF